MGLSLHSHQQAIKHAEETLHRTQVDVSSHTIFGNAPHWEAFGRLLGENMLSLLRDGAIFLHESTWPHTAQQTQNLLQMFGQETSDHPPYSPDLAPSSFQLWSHCFTCDEDIKHATITWLI
jgi:hypothetical protein